MLWFFRSAKVMYGVVIFDEATDDRFGLKWVDCALDDLEQGVILHGQAA
jgi:hypothetical protein